jgi:hypothetical protein
MNSAPNNELLNAIAELRELFPNWRLGQLVANLTTAAGESNPAAVWDVEDERLLEAARRLIESNRAREATPA